MILTQADISARNIIDNPTPGGQRATTYDATVGEILSEGRLMDSAAFVLPPRGIVWVSSRETFTLPADVTGLATLRTRWTHQGILALNVGVIDPSWNSHLATTIVNFGKSDFEIRKGQAFLRVLFFEHKPAPGAQGAAAPDYLESIKEKSRFFSSTFLSMDSLVDEVAEKVFSFPKWAVIFGILGTVFGLLSLIVPIAWAIASQSYVMPSRVDALEKTMGDLQLSTRIGSLEKAVSDLQNPRRLDALEKAVRASQNTARLDDLEKSVNELRNSRLAPLDIANAPGQKAVGAKRPTGR